MKVYIAGPMTGKEYYNLHAFEKAQRHWRLQGHDAVIPFEANSLVWERVYGRPFDPYNDTCDYGDPVLKQLFAEDVAFLLSSDAIVLLDGWEASKGAKLELRIARTFGMPAFDQRGRELTEEEVKDAVAV